METDISRYISFLGACLTVEPARTRAPRGIGPAWLAVRSAPREEHATDQIFYRAGSQSCLAWFISKSKAQGGKHYDGQTADQRAIASIEALSRPQREEIAEAVSRLTVDESVVKWLPRGDASDPSSSTSRKRQRGILSGSTEGELQREPSQPQPNTSSENPSVPKTNMSASSDPHATPSAAGRRGAASEDSSLKAAPVLGAAAAAPDMFANGVQVIERASIKAAQDLFPPYLFGAIKKTEAGASISMDFPHQQSHGIQTSMTFVILPNKLEHIAKCLFNDRLEHSGSSQYILHDHGSKLVPHPRVTLQGAGEKGIAELFGPMVSRAVQSSSRRITELRVLQPTTDCVTLTITANPEDDGILTVDVGTFGFDFHCSLFNMFV